MTLLRRIVCSVIIFLSADIFIIFPFLKAEFSFSVAKTWQAVAAAVFLLLFLLVMIKPKKALPKGVSKNLKSLDKGCELLRLFIISAAAATVFQVCAAFWAIGADDGVSFWRWLGGAAGALAVESVVFWCGMLRIFTMSVQLGIKHRVLAVICAWVPLLNIYYLIKMINTVSEEVKTETAKYELDSVRAESRICAAKYPVLLVHGVFFRDFRYLDYWGRIPKELKRNGAEIYYGGQQSAASVESCGAELADKIREITEKTGCGKVNIIAHSKGGLDSRAAISHFGAAEYVASLTTVNTPHRGCLFADYLLEKIPEKARLSIGRTYNAALKKLGDSSPDFLAAVGDLTAASCARRNENTPDSPEVAYESVMSFCKKARSGKFPLNLSYPLVKHFDGRNDGLVSVDSAKWGEKFTLLEPRGKRGISHGDMIDLNRENIPGFDVREFYVSLVSDLKKRGF